MENTDIITGRTIAFADAFTKAFFKNTYTNIVQQLKEVEEANAKVIKAEKETKKANLKAKKEAKEAKRKAEKEVKEAKLKAEKEVKEAKLKAEKEAKLKEEKLILTLHLEQKIDSSTIATIIEQEETYVKSVLAKHKIN